MSTNPNADPGPDKFRLDGKTAVVTGAGSGIGEAIAHTFAARGARVCVVDLDAASAEATARAIAAAGGRASAHRCDVGDQADVDRVFAEFDRVDILVNNAGVSHIGNVEGTSEADLDRLFHVNVKGPYNCMRACLAGMRARGGGVILNVASIAASAGLADRFAYSMSKGAVLAMTYSVARDYARYRVRCNAISPARVHTPFVDGYLAKHYPGQEQEMFAKLAATQPVGRMGTPQEVADLALYLCSDEAAFVTGTNYPIDGGFLRLHG